MDSIGDMLRRARNDRGFTLDDVAARTRISRKHLEAIERGDRSAIPGGFFYKSFVRQYAAALATAGSDLVDDVEGLLATEQPSGARPQPEHPVSRRVAVAPIEERIAGPRPSSAPASVYGILLLAALIGSTAAYIWWRHSQQAQPAAAASAQVADPARERGKPAALPAAGNGAIRPSAHQVENATPAVAQVEGKIVLDITATDPTWFSLTADGKSVFAGTLQPGESKTFAAEQNARLRVGNAGGLEIKYNGKATGPLGPKGQVRTVVFTPTNFEIVKPVIEDEG